MPQPQSIDTDPTLVPEPEPDRLPFGPYAGQDLASVAVIDPDYVLDLVREGVGPAVLRAEAARALALRGRLAAWSMPDDSPRGSSADRPLPSRPPAWALALALGLLGVVAALLWSRQDSSIATAERNLPATATSQAPGANAQPRARSAGNARGVRSVAGAGMKASSSGTATRPSGTPLPCGARVPGAIPASVAGDFVDTYQAVEFEVVRTKDTGKVTFLNSHDPYQGHFYIAIFPTDYALYPEPPALYFRGKCIVVQGTIELYRGAPQMVLRSPDDVRVVDQPPADPTSARP